MVVKKESLTTLTHLRTTKGNRPGKPSAAARAAFHFTDGRTRSE